MLDLGADGCVVQHVDVFVEHLAGSVDVGDHEDLVVGLEVLHECEGELGLAIWQSFVVAEGVDALPEHQQVLVYRESLVEVVVGAEALVAGQVRDADVVLSALNHEDGVGARACSIGLGLCRLPVPHKDINDGP